MAVVATGGLSGISLQIVKNSTKISFTKHMAKTKGQVLVKMVKF